MKKLIFILFLSFLFASSASATIYKWVDERGAMNFTDNPERIPPAYRDQVEEVNFPTKGPSTPSQTSLAKAAADSRTGRTGMQAPSISQPLIREGDFAITLAGALKLGPVTGEAEAESMLVSAGIAPRNGWIADYPLTPDIIGELQNSISEAADSGKLAMKKDEAMKAFQDLTAQDDLPLRTDSEGRDPGAEQPRDSGEYSNPTVINNYYYDEGPPVVTYYPPPPDYRYLYAWVPYPFWCSRIWFPGFFILHDFHRTVYVNRREARITNHVVDPRTKRVSPIDPVSRGTGKPHHDRVDLPRGKGFASPDAQRGAAAILMHSQDRARSENFRSPDAPNMPGREVPSNRDRNTSTSGRRVIGTRPPTATERMNGNQAGIIPPSMGDGSLRLQGGSNNAGGTPSVPSFLPAPRTPPPGGGSSRTLPRSGAGSGASPGGRIMDRQYR